MVNIVRKQSADSGLFPSQSNNTDDSGLFSISMYLPIENNYTMSLIIRWVFIIRKIINLNSERVICSSNENSGEKKHHLFILSLYFEAKKKIFKK